MTSLQAKPFDVRWCMRGGRPASAFLRNVASLPRERQLSTRGLQGPGDGATGHFPHPDAVRRRREAEARQKKRMEDLAELSAKLSSRSTDTPGNMMNVDCVAEFEWRVARTSRDRLTLVHFKSSSCQSCLRMWPNLVRAARDNSQVQFLVVDVGARDLATLCGKMGIIKIPFFQTYKNGLLTSQGSWRDIEMLANSGDPDVNGPRCCTLDTSKQQ